VQALGTGGYHSFFQLTLPVDEHLAIFAAGLRILLARPRPKDDIADYLREEFRLTVKSLEEDMNRANMLFAVPCKRYGMQLTKDGADQISAKL